MYYQGSDPEIRRAIEIAKKERAEVVAAIWALLFARGEKRIPAGTAEA